MKYRNEIEIDVGRCFRALKNKYRLIIIMSLLFLLIGVACTLGKEKTNTVPRQRYILSPQDHTLNLKPVSVR